MEPPLAPVVVHARGADGDRERRGGLLDREPHGEDQDQDLALPPGKAREGSLERQALFGGRFRSRGSSLPGPFSEQEPPPRVLPPRFRGGAPDDAEEKRLEARSAGKLRPAVEDLQITRLQHVLRILPAPAATGQSPREAGSVKPLELCLGFLWRHRSALHDWVCREAPSI